MVASGSMPAVLGYLDESGDSGVGGSRSFVVACVMVEAGRWPSVFDEVITFRRFLRDRYHLPMRAEIKANALLTNGGAFRLLRLSERARFSIYRGCMRLLEKLELSVFAIVVDKMALLALPTPPDAKLRAWTYALQRIERYTTKNGVVAMLVHDEGDERFIRAVTRRARRANVAGSAYGPGLLKLPARQVIDDPVSRRSGDSYFVQLADLAAYSAFRRLFPPPPRAVHVCPQSMWDEMGAARLEAANRHSGGPPGIVRVVS